MGAPAVSVLLPVRDAMPYLSETLDSLRAQTFEDFEVLVHDDGSRDRSLACARAVAAEDGRFHVEAGEPLGVVAAANALASRARADLFVRIDGDDLAVPERLAATAAFADAHREVGLFGSLVRYFPREGLGPGMRRYEDWINGVRTHEAIVRDRFVELPLAQPSWALRREVFERLGGYRDGPFPEDYEFFLRAVEAGVQFAKVPEVLLRWREHEARTIYNDPRFGLDRFFDLKMRFLLPRLRRAGRALAVVGGGPDAKRWARRLRDEGLDVRYLVDVDPRRIGQTVHGARVLAYDDIARTRDCFLLVALGRAGGREEARRQLVDAGFAEERDFLCVQ
jgi:glycosyltransferase involved in cell wall biosynthesis